LRCRVDPIESVQTVGEEEDGEKKKEEEEEDGDKVMTIAKEGNSNQTDLDPKEGKVLLRLLCDTSDDVVSWLIGDINREARTPGEYPTDVFFLDCIPVPPSKFRPVSYYMEGEQHQLDRII